MCTCKHVPVPCLVGGGPVRDFTHVLIERKWRSLLRKKARLLSNNNELYLSVNVFSIIILIVDTLGQFCLVKLGSN